MRPAPNERIERFRLPDPDGGPPGTNYGAARLLCRGQWLTAVFSCGGCWDHVSVSRPDRCPTWGEMDWVKRQFWHDDEVAMQLHVHGGAKVNNHPFCLHLFRPQTAAEIEAERAAWAAAGEVAPAGYFNRVPGPIPLPPVEFVGLPGVELIREGATA